MRKKIIKSQEQAQGRGIWKQFKLQQQEAFGFSEPGVPVIPAAVMWQNVTAGLAAATQSGTLTSTATTCTSMTATNGLYVGMGISGTGITAGTTIAAIVSSTAITLSLPATASGAQTLTFTLNDPNQSIWAGPPFGGFASPSPAAIATDTPDCPFNIPDVQTLALGSTWVPAPGRGLMVLTSGTTPMTIQYNINGSWTAVFTGTASVASTMYVMCDGVNVRVNCPTTAGSVTFYRERSSKSTSI
jgi:hypothetical protein